MIHLQKDNTGKLRQKIIINNQHNLFVDVARESGGEGSAPEPHDIFDASLAACKALTLKLYAQRKGIPLDEVHVDIERDESQVKNGKYTLRVMLDLIGNLSAEQKQLLMAVAEKCPVHKLMTQTDIIINTQMKTKIKVSPHNT